MSESINRAFMYGESVFTTMRMVEGQLRDWAEHFERLQKGIEFVYGPFTDPADWAQVFKKRLEDQLQHESGSKVIRLTVFLESSRGLRLPGSLSVKDLSLDVSVSTLVQQKLQEKKYKLRSCAAPARPTWWPGFLKSGNYLETILAQKYFLKEGEDDLLFLSPQRTVLESSVANVFMLEGQRLVTSPVGPGVLDGVMRRKVLESAKEFFETAEVREIPIDQLLGARAVFGTNSLRGPFLIDSVDGIDYNHDHEFLAKFDSLRKRVLT